MHWLYILRCADDTLYIGETCDLPQRIAKHNDGGSSFTASRRPLKLVYTEAFENRLLALGRERQLKQWTRAKKEALILGDELRLRRL
jgi:predicted GIY-YIG superfamily endonuclease